MWAWPFFCRYTNLLTGNWRCRVRANFSLTVGLMVLVWCGPALGDAAQIDAIVAGFKSPDPAVRMRAGRDLVTLAQKRGLSEEEGLAALRAAAQPFKQVAGN